MTPVGLMIPNFLRTQKIIQASSDSWISIRLNFGYISLKHCSATISLSFSCAYITDIRAYEEQTISSVKNTSSEKKLKETV